MKKKNTVTITQCTSSKNYLLRNGLRLDALSSKEETGLEFDCRKANCGICIFKVLEGEENLSVMQAKEKGYLQALKAEPNERLACQCRVFGDIKIEIEDFGG